VPACLRACVPACLRACVPACLRACVPACLRASEWRFVGRCEGGCVTVFRKQQPSPPPRSPLLQSAARICREVPHAVLCARVVVTLYRRACCCWVGARDPPPLPRFTFHTAAFASGPYNLGTTRGVDVLVPDVLDDAHVRFQFTLSDPSKVRRPPVTPRATPARPVWTTAPLLCVPRTLAVAGVRVVCTCTQSG
jgi:hypothetical protein